MMHSIAKKGSRLNQRLRDRVVGRDGDQDYDKFNQAARDFQAAEVMCKKLQERCDAYVVPALRTSRMVMVVGMVLVVAIVVVVVVVVVVALVSMGTSLE